MRAWAYYNELDGYAAEWLRNLIKAGHIAPGEVDERDIRDVHPDDVRGFTQCHWFAGIGVWSSALRLAGWPDERPVWTGSCPCQPFSAAGAGAGFDDERHLWPAWQWLIGEQRPTGIFGEQVASKDVEPWIDLVSTDMEGMGYAIGTTPFPSAGIGAPHIRERTYFMAHASSSGRKEQRRKWIKPARSPEDSISSVLADTCSERWEWRQGIQAGRVNDRAYAGRIEGDDGLVCSNEARIQRVEPASPTNGLWRDADWLLCRDGKWRPVEPGTFPLAHGATSRVGRLRAYGNAINREAAATFISAARETIDS